MISLEEFKRAFGPEVDTLTEAQLKRARQVIAGLAELIVDQLLERENIASLVSEPLTANLDTQKVNN